MAAEHEPTTVLVVHGGDIPYRSWMRLNGHRPSGRRSKRRVTSRKCVACGVLCTRDGVRWSLDHIIPQSRLGDAPELVHSPVNHQWLCRSGAAPPADDDPRWVPGRGWEGCNEAKGDGPAVDHRGDPSLYRRLVLRARELGVDEDVAWEPLPYRGIGLPVPDVV